jgi:hypothetical protein
MPRWEIILGAIAIGAALWRQIHMVVGWLKGRLIVVRKTDVMLGYVMLSFMNATMQRSPSASASYGSVRTFVRPLERIYRVVFQALEGSVQLFWRGRWPIWYSADSVKSEENNSARRDYSMSFSFVRGTIDWEKLLLAAAAWEDELLSGSDRGTSRYCVKYHYGTSFVGFDAERRGELEKNTAEPTSTSWPDPVRAQRILQWSNDDVNSSTVISTIDQLSLRPELTMLLDELKFWHESQKWYAEHGMPWRRGCAFHGGPGTGKTSLTRALAEHLDLPIHVFDLASMSNQDLRTAWRRMLNSTPCIALFEDLDAVFVERENVAAKNMGMMGGGGLTFDCLINCLDGIERADGVLLIVTTNRLELLDDAIIKRPGRVDHVVEFQPLDQEGRRKMALRILEDTETADQMSRLHTEDTAAQFQERCFQVALSRRFDPGVTARLRVQKD